MVCLSLFESSLKDQTCRTLISLAIIILGDLFYLYLSTGNLQRFLGNKMAYLNVWVTLAVVFGASVLYHEKGDTLTINNDTIKDYTIYGILIGLLVYVPLLNWMLSCGTITPVMSICNTGFGLVLSGITCLLVFLISVRANLYSKENSLSTS